MSTGPTVVLLSPEPWDAVWRRNQYLAHELVAQNLAGRLRFVEPAARSPRPSFSPSAGIDVVRPPKLVPNRVGGLTATARWLRRAALGDADVLWINDAPLGVRCLPAVTNAVYDVTDDWRTGPLPARLIARLVRAEDTLTRQARVVVCSAELRERWQRRYGVDVPIVHNGIDAAAFAAAHPVTLPGEGPHAGYVGTLHSDRLDVAAVLALAASGVTVHLVGPDVLRVDDRSALEASARVLLHGPVAAAEVPNWLVALDVLVCPHLVTEFTLSLDAIKSYEYLASGRPVVATATSGFQHLVDVPGVSVTDDLAGAVAAALAVPVRERAVVDVSWAHRAREFAVVLGIAS